MQTTSPIQIAILEREELAERQGALRALEQSITYALDAQGQRRFCIDHGPDYGEFFARRGHARFMVVSQEQQVVGTLAGCWHQASLGRRPVRALYLGDLKLAASHRGRGVARQMALYALGALYRERRLRGFELVYGAAMRGLQGDVTRSMKGLHPGRLLEPLAKLQLYFTSPDALLAMDLTMCPPSPQGQGLELSQEDDALWRVNSPCKTLTLLPEREPWALIHLTQRPSRWPEGSLGESLKRAALGIAQAGLAGQLCFALDERLSAHQRWLRGQGLSPGAQCTIYGVWARREPPDGPRAHAWAHLAPCDI